VHIIADLSGPASDFATGPSAEIADDVVDLSATAASSEIAARCGFETPNYF
jgi:AraC-like DNA-binding protein